MKKTLLLVLVAVFALTGMAFAENRVEVKVTSEPIQFHAQCDKAGGFSLEFDRETQLLHGDVITIDVDFGVTLCRDIDLEISPAGSGSTWDGTPAIPSADGPFIAPNGPATVEGDGAYFRLQGNSGTQRITLTVVGFDSADDGYTVGTAVDDTLILSFLGQRTNATWGNPGLWIDDDNDGVYDVAAEVADNTLCINVSQWDENTVDGNMDSLADKFTFIPSDPQIAHVVSPTNYEVITCEKVATGNIVVGGVGGQGGNDSCVAFDWDQINDPGYCSNHANGNRFIVQTTDVFKYYDVADYQIEMTITTDGVYWTDEAVVAYAYESSTNVCAGDSPVGSDTFTADYYDAIGGDTTAVSNADTDCDFEDEAVTLVTDCSTSLITAGNARAIVINIPGMKYKLDEITMGDEVLVDITFIKCPCGELWTETLSVGVLGCPDEPGVTFSLLYPYGTAMAGDTWWDGFVVTNISADAGSATLYFWEADGDQGQMVVSVPAGGMFVGTFANMLTALPGGQIVQGMTQIGGTGVIGDSSLYVIACTDFSCDGFIFMGNGVATARGEAMGYLPRDDKTGICSAAD